MTVDTTEPEDTSIPTRRSPLLIAVVVGVALGVFSLLEGGVGGRLFGILVSRT